MAIKRKISRRDFVGRGATLAAGAALAGAAGPWPLVQRAVAERRKIRTAIVGTGGRGTGAWGTRLQNVVPDVEFVGLCDINWKRVEVAKSIIGTDAPTYRADEFERMIEETDPDLVIVTTTDSFHADYAVRTMEMGRDVLSEKPLATEADQCQRLLEAEDRTGQRILMGFNSRYMRESAEIKKILAGSRLGRIHSVGFEEYLDTQHGASYFRRWHGKAKYSGTLLVHKASHHFDLINWWLDSDPVEVQAYGKVGFYGHNNSFRSDHCRGCEFQDECDFYWDIMQNERVVKMYVECEDVDGYAPDGCVWDNENDSYDSATVSVKYENGVLASYTLNAFMPYEGQKMAFTGSNGRLDVRKHIRQPWDVPNKVEMRLTENFKGTTTWSPSSGSEEGGHGGADPRLKKMLFDPDMPDPLGQRAGSRAGVLASLIGIAARKSIEEDRHVHIDELIDIPVSWTW